MADVVQVLAQAALIVWLGVGFTFFLGCVLDGDNPWLGLLIWATWPAILFVGLVRRKARKLLEAPRDTD